MRIRKHSVVRGPCPDGKFEIVRPDGTIWNTRFDNREDACSTLLNASNPFRTQMEELNRKLRDALQIAGYDSQKKGA